MLKRILLVVLLLPACRGGPSVNFSSDQPRFIAEIMPAPLGAGTEWIKIHNPTSAPIRLGDLSLRIEGEGGEELTVKNGSDWKIPPDGSAVLSGQAASWSTWSLGRDNFLPDSGGRIRLVLDDKVVDELSYGQREDSNTPPIVPGRSLTLSTQCLDTDCGITAKNWFVFICTPPECTGNPVIDKFGNQGAPGFPTTRWRCSMQHSSIGPAETNGPTEARATRTKAAHSPQMPRTVNPSTDAPLSCPTCPSCLAPPAAPQKTPSREPLVQQVEASKKRIAALKKQNALLQEELDSIQSRSPRSKYKAETVKERRIQAARDRVLLVEFPSVLLGESFDVSDKKLAEQGISLSASEHAQISTFLSEFRQSTFRALQAVYADMLGDEDAGVDLTLFPLIAEIRNLAPMEACSKRERVLAQILAEGAPLPKPGEGTLPCELVDYHVIRKVDELDGKVTLAMGEKGRKALWAGGNSSFSRSFNSPPPKLDAPDRALRLPAGDQDVSPPSDPEAAEKGISAGDEDDVEMNPLVWEGTKEGIETALKENIGKLHNCYSAWARKQPDLGGRLVIGLTVEKADDEMGRITNISVQDSELRHPFMEGCILGVVTDLRFTNPEETPLTLQIPMVFRAQ